MTETKEDIVRDIRECVDHTIALDIWAMMNRKREQAKDDKTLPLNLDELFERWKADQFIAKLHKYHADRIMGILRSPTNAPSN